MEHVLAVGLIVEAIENASDCFRCRGRERNSGVSRKRPLRMPSTARKLPNFVVPKPSPMPAASGAERAIARVDIAEDLARAEAGARGDLRHQAGLVAEFGAAAFR